MESDLHAQPLPLLVTSLIHTPFLDHYSHGPFQLFILDGVVKRLNQGREKGGRKEFRWRAREIPYLCSNVAVAREHQLTSKVGAWLILDWCDLMSGQVGVWMGGI